MKYYKIMRLVKKDARHIFIDLWNEEITSNVELTMTFNTILAMNIFYEVLNDRMCNNYEITLSDICIFYDYWGGIDGTFGNR